MILQFKTHCTRDGSQEIFNVAKAAAEGEDIVRGPAVSGPVGLGRMAMLILAGICRLCGLKGGCGRTGAVCMVVVRNCHRSPPRTGR